MEVYNTDTGEVVEIECREAAGDVMGNYDVDTIAPYDGGQWFFALSGEEIEWWETWQRREDLIQAALAKADQATLDKCGAEAAYIDDLEALQRMYSEILGIDLDGQPKAAQEEEGDEMDTSRLFQMYELEAYLGDYVEDFDVDAIIDEATEIDYSDGNRYWIEGIDLNEIAMRHDVSTQEPTGAALAEADVSTQEPTGTAVAEADGVQQRRYARVKMPAAFLTPYKFTSKDGREFDKAYVRIPPETKVNGIDLGGYSCDVFLSEYMIGKILAGEQVTLRFNEAEKVAVWTGKRDDPEHPYKRYEVSPWALVKGIKAANEEFKVKKAAEREAAKESTDGIKGKAEAVRNASAALSSEGNRAESISR